MEEEEALKTVIGESRKFVEYYLAHKEDSYNTGGGGGVESKSYNLSNFIENLAAKLPKADLMDLLFYCPFDFSFVS